MKIKVISKHGCVHLFRTGVPKLSLVMYHFSTSIDEHVPLKFIMTKSIKK